MHAAGQVCQQTCFFLTALESKIPPSTALCRCKEAMSADGGPRSDRQRSALGRLLLRPSAGSSSEACCSPQLGEQCRHCNQECDSTTSQHCTTNYVWAESADLFSTLRIASLEGRDPEYQHTHLARQTRPPAHPV